MPVLDVFDVLLIVIVAAGTCLRIRQWWWARSIWGDEASVVVQVTQRGYGALTKPLGGFQAAPIGWLWAERTSFHLFGTSERSFRMFPLLCGIGALVLLAIIVRKTLPPVAGVIALSAVVVTEPLSYYANEAKPYATDVMVTLVVLLATLHVQRSPTRRGFIGWVASIVIGLQFSYPTVITAAGCTASVFVIVLWRHRAQIRGFLVAAAAWVGFFIVDYVLVLHLNNSKTLHDYWAFAYAPTPLKMNTLLPWTQRSFEALVGNPLGLASAGVVLTMIGVGLLRLLMQKPELGLPILFTTAVAWLAAVARAYPLAERCSLFFAPLLLIALSGLALPIPARAIANTQDRLSRRRIALSATVVIVGGAFGLAVLVAPAQATANAIHHPTTHEEVREALDTIRLNQRPGDVLFVNGYQESAVIYYKLRRMITITGTATLANGCDDRTSLTPLLAYHRVWFLTGVPGLVNAADTPELEFKHIGLIGAISHRLDIPAKPPAGIFPTQVGVGLATIRKGQPIKKLNDGYCLMLGS